MSQWSANLSFEVDDELLGEHPGAKTSPPNSVEEWSATDLFRAHELGFLDPLQLKLEARGEPTAPTASLEEEAESLGVPLPQGSAAERQALARLELEAADLYEATDEEDRERMIGAAASLVGHSVTDSNGRRWPVATVGMLRGWPTISSATYWDRAEAVIDHGPAITAQQAIQTLREVLAEEGDVVEAVELLLPRVHPLADERDPIPLCPRCASEDVRPGPNSDDPRWSCRNCGASFDRPLQEAG